MYRRGIRCPKCWDCLYSAYQHDFRYCFCGYCFVDGGTTYTRIGYGGEEFGSGPWAVPGWVRIDTKQYVRDEWPYAFKLQES